MSDKKNKKFNNEPSSAEAGLDDPLVNTGLASVEVPPGVDRRSFLIRSAVVDDGQKSLSGGTNVRGRQIYAAATLLWTVRPQEG